MAQKDPNTTSQASVPPSGKVRSWSFLSPPAVVSSEPLTSPLAGSEEEGWAASPPPFSWR